MTDNNIFRCHTLACGFAHSAAISQKGQLYVWGENQDARLQKIEKGTVNKQKVVKNALLKIPTQIKLSIKNKNPKADTKEESKQDLIQYNAMSVACGQNSVFVCSQLDNPSGGVYLNQMYDDNPDAKEVLMGLRRILMGKGTLLEFFGFDSVSAEDKKHGRVISFEKQTEAMNNLQNDDFKEPALAYTYKYEIEQETFKQKVSEPPINATKTVAQQLIRILSEYTKTEYDLNSFNDQSKLYVGDIEDMAMGFRQNNIKMFAFGHLHQDLRAFEPCDEDDQAHGDAAAKKGKDKDDAKETNMMKKLRYAMEKENAKDWDPIKIITKPQIIKFPMFTKPIVSVACGFYHTLALSIDYEMYSWGNGSYGALGFGMDKDHNVTTPTKLEIKDFRDQVYGIIQICCGKFHSMCLTQQHNIFTWGEGSYGRLGHGEDDEDDYLEPKEIYSLSQRRPIILSASESHSAAITDQYKLFTWGNGGYGRLGHGDSLKQSSPKVVDALKHHKIVDVSLGATHTLACDSHGNVYTFGQSKDSKLGIHFSKKDEIDKAVCDPIKIAMYKQDHANVDPKRIKKCKIVTVCAGFNHSMSVSKAQQGFTWGYQRLLGRIPEEYKDFNTEVGIAIDQYQMGKEILSGFEIRQEHQDWLISYCNDRAKLLDIAGGKAKVKIIDDEDAVQSNTVLMLRAGSANSVILTSSNEVIVVGDNSYGQLACNEIEPELPEIGKTQEELEEIQKFSLDNMRFILFPQLSVGDRIISIACGASHLIVQTNLDDIFGWGRNDEGQIGCGYLTEKIIQPVRVRSLQFKGTHQIICGEDYSAACTMYGQVYTTGSLEGGKLGLGKGMKRGYQLEFKEIPNLPQIDQIACGPMHMLAISRFQAHNPEDYPGLTYSWGKNLRGQLGIGNKDNQLDPQPILTAKERFKKVACGKNFTLGLSLTNRVYFWGNLRYFLDLERKKDVEEPMVIAALENDEVVDIGVCYKYCVALLENGAMKQWGIFLNKKYDGKTREELQEKKDEKMRIRANRKKGQPIDYDYYGDLQFVDPDHHASEMDQMSISSNHAVGIGQNGKPYSWGYNNISNRLGIDSAAKEKMAKACPVVMESIFEAIEKREYENHLAHMKSAHANDPNAHGDLEGDHHDNTHDSQGGEGEGDSEGEEEDGEAGGDEAGSHDQPQMADQDIQPGDAEPSPGDGQAGGGAGGAEGADGDDGGGQAAAKGKKKNKKGGEKKGGGEETAGAGKQKKGNGKETRFTMNFPKLIDQFNEFENVEYNKNPGRKQNFLQIKYKQELNVFEPNVDYYTLEFIRQGMHIWEEPSQTNFYKMYQRAIDGGQDDPDHLITFQQYVQDKLKREEEDELDEKTIGVLDFNLYTLIRKVLLQVHKFTSQQIALADTKYKTRTSFVARIEQQPFNLDDKSEPQRLMYLGIQSEILTAKPLIKQILLHLNLHPCYIVNIIKMGNNDKLPHDEQKLLIKQLLSGKSRQQQARQTQLLLYVFEKVLEFELRELDLEDIELFSPECKLMSVYIFRRIFKANQVNIDTICCIYAHIVNTVMTQCQPMDDGPSDILDVEDKIAKEAAKEAAAAKGPKGPAKASTSNPAGRARSLMALFEAFIQQLLRNEILKEAGGNFQYKRKIIDQLEFMRKQVKSYQDQTKSRLSAIKRAQGQNVSDDDQMDIKLAGLDDEDIKKMYPSLRFSSEVALMIKILFRVLKNKVQDELETKDGRILTRDQQLEMATSNVLGLVFVPQIEKINKHRDLFLYPYLQKVKMVQQTEDAFNKIQTINIQNMIHMLITFLTGKPPFEKKTDEWARDMQNRMKVVRRKQFPSLVNRFNKLGREIDGIRSYKNFENMILHCLEPENTNVCISKKLIGQIINLIINNKDHVSTMSPSKNDPLIKLAQKVDDKIYKALVGLPDHNDQMNIKLKTRIFLVGDVETTKGEGVIDQYVRCNDCDAILTKEMAVQNFDENLALKMYELQDQQSLINQYSQILKMSYLIDHSELKNLKKKIKRDKDASGKRKEAYKGFDTYIRISDNKAKQDKNYKLRERIVKFIKKLDSKCSNIRTMREKQEDKKKERDKEKYVEPKIEGDLDNFIYNQANVEIFKECEEKMNERIVQKFRQKLVEKTIKHYLWPKVKFMVENFKENTKPEALMLAKNYSYGLSNKDIIHLTTESNYQNALANMVKVKQYIEQLGESKDLSNTLEASTKQRLKGYLCVDMPTLIADKTVLKVGLSELEALMPKCHLILIAQDTQALVVELKVVFREEEKPLCGPPKVLSENTMMKFNIYPKQLQMMRNKVIKEKTLRNLTGGDAGAAKKEEEKEEIEPLIFDENEAIHYDPDKFMVLLNQMERQTAAYVLTAM